MIRQLISDLTSGTIKVSTALKKCKIIQSVFEDQELDRFSKNELEGYSLEELPSYRKVIGVPKAFFRNIGDRMEEIVELNFTKINEQIGANFNERKIIFSIIEIEHYLETKHDSLCIDFTADQLKFFLDSQKNTSDSGWILQNAWWSFQFPKFQKIYSDTENKLLDILVRINKKNPHLDQELDFSESKNKPASIQTIIHGSIIGSNLGIGENIAQRDITLNYNQEITDVIEKIISLGFEKNDTRELEQLLIAKKETGANIGKQLMSWIGKLTTKAIEKGIEYQIPIITQIISNYL